jgi:nucleoside-diphosphate-sugar epimerase
MEWWYKNLRISTEPLLTANIVNELSLTHIFDTEAIENTLGFIPKVSVEEGLKNYKNWLKSSMD